MVTYMPNHFRILQSTRVIESYLSRDKFMIEKLGDSYGTTLYDKKIKQHNELVVAVNNLYGELVDTGGQPLFDLLPLWAYASDPAYEAPDNSAYDVVAEAVVTDPPVTEPVPVVDETNHDTVSDEASSEQGAWHDEEQDDERDTQQDEQRDDEQDDELDEEQDEDVEDERDDREEDVDTDGLGDLGDQDEAEEDVSERGQAAAGQILDEYEKTSAHDVSTYNPEDHAPVDVLATAHVMTHSADNVRINEDPLQMASVTTQSEIVGNVSEGADIPINQFGTSSRKVSNQAYDDLFNQHARNLGIITDESDVDQVPAQQATPATPVVEQEDDQTEKEESFAPDDASFVTREDLSKDSDY